MKYYISLDTFEDGTKYLGSIEANDHLDAVEKIAKASPAIERGCVNKFWVRPKGSMVELEVNVKIDAQ